MFRRSGKVCNRHVVAVTDSKGSGEWERGPRARLNPQTDLRYVSNEQTRVVKNKRQAAGDRLASAQLVALSFGALTPDSRTNTVGTATEVVICGEKP